MASPPSDGLPKPQFVDEVFSTKKEKKFRTPKFRTAPPKPQAKTSSPVSRIFKPKPEFRLAHSAKDEPYFRQAFLIETKLGAGYFGTVYRVRSKVDNQLYAIKVFNEKYRGSIDRSRKLDEVRKLQMLLPHPNCVRFFSSWEENNRLYQQFELCQISLDEIASAKHELEESIIWGYLVDLLHGLEHLHCKSLIHLDIKPENIFVGIDGRCKLGDFGLMIDLNSEVVSGPMGGDARYLAAETLKGIYTKAADVFSLGITILELATDLDLPTSGPLWHQLRDIGPNIHLTKSLSQDMKGVLQLMMGRDHERRPTVKELLSMPEVEAAKSAREWELQRKDIEEQFHKMCVQLYVVLGWLLVMFIFAPLQRLLSGMHWKCNNHIRQEDDQQAANTIDPFDASNVKVAKKRSQVSEYLNREKLVPQRACLEDEMHPPDRSESSVLASPLPSSSSPEQKTSIHHDGFASARVNYYNTQDSFFRGRQTRSMTARRNRQTIWRAKHPLHVVHPLNNRSPNLELLRATSQKRLDFDSLPDSDDELNMSFQDEYAPVTLPIKGEENEIESYSNNDENLEPRKQSIKPISLAATFDAFSEDSE